ncbi:MAG: hypothetical protein BROFUL_02035 [Candidatus Brocadia fulgida]|uniref:Uncharacterized protein n=1 Tax=Candidatus Brocadia fulgida TaxID=380242 RepID=A0A0M2UUF0_9BACT|nr:MAG: hypothetical protein BROFUL_02035 [Candidatus Brocadia fulgida]MBV6517992.1 hypothetical protein [Candidatus Brocadia fulgida]
MTGLNDQVGIYINCCLDQFLQEPLGSLPFVYIADIFLAGHVHYGFKRLKIFRYDKEFASDNLSFGWTQASPLAIKNC